MGVMKHFARLPALRPFGHCLIFAAALCAGPGLAGSGEPAAAAGDVPAGPAISAPAKRPPSPDLATSKVVQSVAHRVYRLLVDVDGAVKGGTAFLVSGKRIVATNNHVVEQGTAFSVGYVGEGGHIRRVPLRVIAIFPQKDLALLEALDDLPGDPLPLSASYPGLATDLFAIGFPAAADPQGLSAWSQDDDETFFLPSVLKGYVSRILMNRWFSSQLQHQTPIIPGYSGGPLINDNGVVVAISSSIHKEANGVSYGVLAADLVNFIDACALPVDAVKGNPPPLPSRAEVRNTLPTASMHVVQAKLPPDASDIAMLARGNDFLERGDITAARLIFRYLISRGDLPEAYAGLARTYDPIFLNQKNVIGVSGDSEKAREFYEKAASLGGNESTRQAFAALPGKPGRCDGSVCKLVNSANGPVVVCEKSDPTLVVNNALGR